MEKISVDSCYCHEIQNSDVQFISGKEHLLIFAGDNSTVRHRTQRRRNPSYDSAEEGIPENEIFRSKSEADASAQWKRILLLVSRSETRTYDLRI